MNPGEMERVRRQAEAEVERRKRQGEWQGAVAAHESYQHRPLEWIEEYLGVPRRTIEWSLNPGYEDHEWDGTVDPFVKMFDALANWTDCGLESGTGTGKTFGAACGVFWFLACHEDSIVVTAAPKQDQLLNHLWKEVGALWDRFHRHFPEAQLLTGKIRMKPAEGDREKWAATAFVTGVGAEEEAATKAQGWHAQHMLIITEETPGVHPAIIKAFDNTRTSDHNLHLALGNPDSRHDPLHQFCLRESVEHIRISALDHPNIVTGEEVVPGAIGVKRLRERTEDYGEGSRLYQSRVRGISPTESSDALIRWEWLEEAAKKYHDPQYRLGAEARGADVAHSENGDEASISRWIGACCDEVTSWQCSDAAEVGRQLVSEIRANQIDPRHVGIDSVGVGGTAVEELRREGIRVRHISGGTKAVPGLDKDDLWSTTEPDLEGNIKPSGPAVVEANQFQNLRCQVWWRLREDLRRGRIALPYDQKLFRDLTTPAWWTQNGKIVVEPKEKIVERLGRSPDRGDAVAYGNFVRQRVPGRQKVTLIDDSDPERDTQLEKRMLEETKRRVARNRAIARRFGVSARRKEPT